MQFGESRERQLIETRDVFAVAPGDQWQHIISSVIPSADGCMRATAGNHSELRKRRRADEPLVRKNFVCPGMIDGQQPYLVEIYRLFHRLHEPEANKSIPRFHAARRHLQILVRVWNIP